MFNLTVAVPPGTKPAEIRRRFDQKVPARKKSIAPEGEGRGCPTS